MSMNREHALELLTLLAVLAVVQVPIHDSARSSAGTTPTVAATGADPSSRVSPEPATGPHRLDPIALLQASVPDAWRVSILGPAFGPRSAIGQAADPRSPRALESGLGASC